MGYYTTYKLTVSEPLDDFAMPIIDNLRDVSSDAKYALDADGSSRDSCKWYDHETELKSFSAKYPDILFTLNGEGEESGDVWVKYFKGGKMQVEKAVIQLAPFDPVKLR